MNASEPYAHLLALTHRLLESLTAPALAPFLADWPVSPDPPRIALHGADVPSALPVLRWLPHIAADAQSFGCALVAAMCRAAPYLWRSAHLSQRARLDRRGAA